MAKRPSQFIPNYAVPPGETLLETIDALNMSQADLAERMGRPKKTINEIIKGKVEITPDTALQLERVLGIPASFWNYLEQNYRADLARLAEKERLTADLGWLDEIPHRAMKSLGWIQDVKDKVPLMQTLLDFFGVASPNVWRERWTSPQAAFRKSPVFETNPGAVAAWLRKGELEGAKIHCQPFDPTRFEKKLSSIRELTLQPPEVFVPKLQELCAETGVAVVFVPTLPRLPISGATSWLSSNKALIQLSLRYKTDDQMWFTFFHEAGHILLHGKKQCFLEERTPGSTDKMERDANDFAAKRLIQPEAFARFRTGKPFSEASIVSFARSIGVAPGIVVGRLQHEKIIPFSHLNSLKQKLDWKARTEQFSPTDGG